jgi:putative tryptophan/tyrosine transport system substrate-binding protein
MRRRRFLTGLGAAAAVGPLAAYAQTQAAPRIGWLSILSADAENDPAIIAARNAFKRGLAEYGFFEGKNIAFEYRYADGDASKLPKLAAELVDARVSIILAASSLPTALAAKNATATIPIIFVMGGDPVALGLVAGLNRPGGNMTGVMILRGPLVSKQIEMLHEALPNAARFAMFTDPATDADNVGETAPATARALGIELVQLSVRHEEEYDRAFLTIADQHIAGLIISGNSLFTNHHSHLAANAAKYRIPTIFPNGDLRASGGLMSYGLRIPDTFFQVGTYAGRILQGARPADLPIEQPTRFDFVLNLKAAQSLGLTLPVSLLARADEVIE